MKRLISLTLALGALASFVVASPARAEDEIGVAVEVLSTEGAPSVRANFFVPVGKKSDAATLSFSLFGLEANRDVLFAVTPLPDAFARGTADKNGRLKIKIELPYGLEPGRHEIVANTYFSSDDIPAAYTVGEIFVSDFGILTTADGTYPKGTRPAPVLLETSAQKFSTAPKFLAPKGSLRVSEPQLRITQSWLPSATAALSFNNSTNAATTFSAKVTLLTIFGTQVGEPYFANIDALPAGETSTILLKYPNLPPVGLFTLRTELQLPNDFVASQPVETSVSSNVFIAPFTAWSIGSLIVLLSTALAMRWKLKNSRKNRIGAAA